MNDNLTKSGSMYYPLFEHMSKNHGLTLTDSELFEICRVSHVVYGDLVKDKCGKLWCAWCGKWTDHQSGSCKDLIKENI